MAVTKQQAIDKQNLWEQEMQKRKEFGISEEFFYKTQFANLRYFQIKFFKDFESLYYLSVSGHYDKDRNRLLKESVRKYKSYTFSQLKNAGGALQLSLTCPFVYTIVNENFEYNGCKIDIFHRTKNASESNMFPKKVLDIFKKDNKCKAVAFLFKSSLTRCVIIEKFKDDDNSPMFC